MRLENSGRNGRNAPKIDEIIGKDEIRRKVLKYSHEHIVTCHICGDKFYHPIIIDAHDVYSLESIPKEGCTCTYCEWQLKTRKTG